MDHLTAMSARLPTIYGQGELLSLVLGHLANQVAFLDEDMTTIRREHAFERALDLADAAALADLLDLAPEPWTDVDTYRAWVNAIVRTTVTLGAVTVPALQELVFQYVSRYQQATGDVAIPAFDLAPDGARRPRWLDATADPVTLATSALPALVENPPIRRYGPATADAHPAPLHRFTVTSHGMDPAPLGLLLTGTGDDAEACPLIAHLASQQALIYLGTIQRGQRLWIRPNGNSVTARLEGQDVTADLRTITGFTPGTPWLSGAVVPAAPLMMTRGDNDLWFLSVAVYDEPGLDRFLLTLPDLTITQGRFDTSNFEQALFAQDAAVRLDLTWVEIRPSAFSIRLPAGMLSSAASGADDEASALTARDRLASSLAEAVGRFRAAGVVADVQLQPFTETTNQYDALTGILPLVEREGGPSGADRLPDSGGRFGVTRFEESTFG